LGLSSRVLATLMPAVTPNPVPVGAGSIVHVTPDARMYCLRNALPDQQITDCVVITGSSIYFLFALLPCSHCLRAGRPRGRSSSPCKVKNFTSSNRTDRFCSPLSLLFKGYRRTLSWG
jgi:hypothetical protein